MMIIVLSLILTANAETVTSSSSSDSDDAISAFVIGWILFIASFPILWFNERRHLITQKRIHTAEDYCRTTSSLEVNPNYHMSLVHVIGETQSNALVFDPLFNLQEANTIKIERQVEMYQWVRHESRRNKRTYYAYDRQWKSQFQECDSYEHVNKLSLWTVKQETFINPSVFLGAYTLTESLKSQTIAEQSIVLTLEQQNYFKQNPEHWQHPNVFQQEEYLYLQQNQTLLVGDLRVKLLKVPCGTHTVISQQVNTTFQPYQIHDCYEKLLDEEAQDKGCCASIKNMDCPIKDIDWILSGNLSKLQAFSYKLWEERKYTYLMRLAGWFIFTIVASHIEGRNPSQCAQRWKRIKGYKLRKQWSEEENNLLKALVVQYGQRWSKISQQLSGRSGKQIREHYLNQLHPGLSNDPWTQEEDEKIIEIYKSVGGRWSVIQKELKGRSENNIKNRFYSYLRNKYLNIKNPYYVVPVKKQKIEPEPEIVKTIPIQVKEEPAAIKQNPFQFFNAPFVQYYPIPYPQFQMMMPVYVYPQFQMQ